MTQTGGLIGQPPRAAPLWQRSGISGIALLNITLAPPPVVLQRVCKQAPLRRSWVPAG
jgi:hypothetical protein